MEARIARLESDVARLRSDVGRMERDLRTVRGKIDGLQAKSGSGVHSTRRNPGDAAQGVIDEIQSLKIWLVFLNFGCGVVMWLAMAAGFGWI
jgi:hypothetical protein